MRRAPVTAPGKSDVKDAEGIWRKHKAAYAELVDAFFRKYTTQTSISKSLPACDSPRHHMRRPPCDHIGKTVDVAEADGSLKRVSSTGNCACRKYPARASINRSAACYLHRRRMCRFSFDHNDGHEAKTVDVTESYGSIETRWGN